MQNCKEVCFSVSSTLTLPSEKLSFEFCRKIYRVRSCIELLFSSEDGVILALAILLQYTGVTDRWHITGIARLCNVRLKIKWQFWHIETQNI